MNGERKSRKEEPGEGRSEAHRSHESPNYGVVKRGRRCRELRNISQRRSERDIELSEERECFKKHTY